MSQILLSQLAEDAKDVTLRLRLLHRWKAGSPLSPETFFACSTLWADKTGARIEGTALPIHTEHLESTLQAGVVYDLTSFALTFPRRSHRATSNNRYLQLTSATVFEEVEDPDEGFVLDSFEFVPFGQLSLRAPPFPFLTDVVGRLVVLSEPDHVTTVRGVARKQSVTISDDRWGQLSLASSSATRIMVDPQVVHPLLESLRDVPGSAFDVLQAKFPSPELIEEHVRDSFRTIAELHDLAHSTAPNVRPERISAWIP
ncbi:hypothetical protein LINGRAHAP2_LOCUS25661 [Linum grandiflorum]